MTLCRKKRSVWETALSDGKEVEEVLLEFGGFVYRS